MPNRNKNYTVYISTRIENETNSYFYLVYVLEVDTFTISLDSRSYTNNLGHTVSFGIDKAEDKKSVIHA